MTQQKQHRLGMNRQRNITRWVVVTVLVAAVVCGWVFVPGALMSQPRPPTITVADPQPATVLRVIDGDTLIVKPEDGSPVTVRILGVDTPEASHPDRPVQCYGPEAAHYLAELLPHGTPVLLATDTHQDTQDRYGRELRHVLTGHTSAPQLVAEQLLLAGYGTRYQGTPTDYDTRLEQAERIAKQSGAGLWGACPTP